MLQIVIADIDHIGFHMGIGLCKCYQFGSKSHIALTKRKLYHLCLDVVHDRGILHIRKETITVIKIHLSRIQLPGQHIKFSQIRLAEILFKYHLRVRFHSPQSTFHKAGRLPVILFVVKMVTTVIEISEFLRRIHLGEILSCHFIIIIRKVKVTKLHVCLSQAVVHRKLIPVGQIQGITDE